MDKSTASPRWISDWNPEDPVFWERTGKSICAAQLHLVDLAENIGFSVWLVWSITATRLPSARLSLLDGPTVRAHLPTEGLVGAILRFPYTFAVPRARRAQLDGGERAVAPHSHAGRWSHWCSGPPRRSG